MSLKNFVSHFFFPFLFFSSSMVRLSSNRTESGWQCLSRLLRPKNVTLRNEASSGGIPRVCATWRMRGSSSQRVGIVGGGGGTTEGKRTRASIGAPSIRVPWPAVTISKDICEPTETEFDESLNSFMALLKRVFLILCSPTMTLRHH